MTFRLLTLAAIILICPPSCADKPGEKPTDTKEERELPKIIGRIASIPADREFALIQAYGTWEIPNGSVLTTHGLDGRAANLRVTGEKLGQYAAADIQSGTLEIGDAVYSTIAPVEQAPAPVVDQNPGQSTTE